MSRFKSKPLRKFVVLTGPSGAGKTTIYKALLKNKNLKLDFSCSVTTRKPRGGEKEGKEYYFVSEKEFKEMIAKEEFIEWNTHFGNNYGTLKKEIERIQNNGKIPLLEIDVDGAKEVIKKYGNDKVLSIFIVPPSIEDLKQRLVVRKTENTIEIKRRLERVEKELQAIQHFKYVVVNKTPAQAIKEISNLINRSFK